MAYLKFPLFCRRVGPDHICGTLLHGQYELVDSNIKRLKSMLSEKLREDLDHGYISEPTVTSSKLKMMAVTVHPSYKTEDGNFPAPTPVVVNVPVVVGSTEDGYSECRLPLFGESFYFYDPARMTGLVEHFTRDYLRNMPPEEVHRFIEPGEFWLESVPVKDKRRKLRGRPEFDPREVPVLSGIAARMPPSRSERRANRMFPESAWERGDEVRRLIERFTRDKSGVLVMGDTGVGKSAVLMEAIRGAHRITASEKEGRPMTFWRTTPHRMISGARYLGEWQELCENIVEELQRVDGVLWLMDFLNLFAVGGEGPEDSVAAFLKPFVARGELRIVAEVTPSELEAARRLLPGFTEFMPVFPVEQMEPARVRDLLGYFRDFALRGSGIRIRESALELTYNLLDRYIKYENFPGKAVRFLSNRLNDAYLEERSFVDDEHVIRAFVRETGLPQILLRDDLPLPDEELSSFFSDKIIGQPGALETVSSVVRIFKAGLNNPHKPIASMIFAGPTGVGKTACARALADYFFGKRDGAGKQDPLIRLDMSEFQYPDQIDRLIGDVDSPSRLIQMIRERPFAVLLLDEIEKAHDAVFDALLSLLDEGLLTDALGRVTDFRNTIVIMTSNLGAGRMASVGFARENSGDDAAAGVKEFFRPEFYNRIDHIVSFQALDKDAARVITDLELAGLAGRDGLAGRGIRLEFSDALRKLLMDNGFDERFGARPLQRTMEQLVTSKLAAFLLRHRDTRDCLLRVDAVSSSVVVSRV